MDSQNVKRKLTAILSADVKGYSRMMGEDDVATVQTLKDCRKIMASAIQAHHGRIVDSPGDNLLAEFASVLDATQCAVKIQQALDRQNARLPENRKMKFRIGINLGDVIQDESRIYGDGVNIAARLEGLAEAGGICISGSVYEQVKNKLSLEFDYLGDRSVKNIFDPISVYRVIWQAEAISLRAGKKRRAAGLQFFNASKRPLLTYMGITCLVLYGAKFLIRKKKRVKLNFFVMGMIAAVLISVLAIIPVLFGLANFLVASLVFIPLAARQMHSARV